MAAKKEDPAKYESDRQKAIRLGLIDEPYKERIAREFKERNEPRKFDNEELRIRVLYPESEVKKFYKGDPEFPNNPAFDMVKLSQDDPKKFYEIRLAGWSYGFGQSRPSKPEAPVQSAEIPYPLAPELVEKFNLPTGTQMTTTEFLGLVALHAQIENEKREAKTADKDAEPVTSDATPDKSAAKPTLSPTPPASTGKPPAWQYPQTAQRQAEATLGK